MKKEYIKLLNIYNKIVKGDHLSSDDLEYAEETIETIDEHIMLIRDTIAGYEAKEIEESVPIEIENEKNSFLSELFEQKDRLNALFSGSTTSVTTSRNNITLKK